MQSRERKGHGEHIVVSVAKTVLVSIGQITVSKPDGLMQSFASMSQLSDHSGLEYIIEI